jgi:hypothetical protein
MYLIERQPFFMDFGKIKIDSSGSLIWTIHLPKSYDNVYLVDEDWVYIDK